MGERLLLESNNIYLGDALELLDSVASDSVDLVVTDPPYFLDKMDNNWSRDRLSSRTRSQVVNHLPSGMKFDPEQGKRLQEWYYKVSLKILRVLKPGGYFFSFSSPRLVHRMALAVEDSGFYVRDLFIWLYREGWSKASSLERYVDEEHREMLKGWKTPQVRGNYEPIIVAQKPPEGPLAKNFVRSGVGLFNFYDTKDYYGKSPSNVIQTDIFDGLPPIFLVSKPSREEKGDDNDHPTVKPVELIRHLIKLSSKEGALVLDPFIGSGTTALASIMEKRNFLGFEIDEHYFELARRRIGKLLSRIDKSQTL